MSATFDSLLRDTAVALSAAGIDNVRFEARLLLGRASGGNTQWRRGPGRRRAAV